MNEEENTIFKTNIYNMNIIVNYSKIKISYWCEKGEFKK